MKNKWTLIIIAITFSSGIYFIKLTSGSVEKTQKLMLLK